MLEVLRRVGGSQGSAAPSSKAERMARRLAPRRDVARPTPQREPSIPLVCDAEVVHWQGDDPGFVDSWDRPAGEAAAAFLQLELTDEMWTLAEWVRTEYETKGKSPNIRRIAKGSGVGTKAIYTMFPHKPGSAVARIAGVPRPVGCI
jgi:sulfide:quinone oxidoreductase